MTTDGELLWPEPWASHAAVQATAIAGELNRTLAKPHLTEVELAVRENVRHLLHKARAATKRGSSRWRRPLDRWRGTSVERSHFYLHAAKIAIVDVLDEQEIDARIPGAVARVSTCLPPTDLRRPSIEALLDVTHLTLAQKRVGLKRAMEMGYDASDQLHARIRGFRNLLISVGVTILLFMAVMVTLVSFSPESVPLCFTPSITAPQPGGTTGGTTGGTDATRTVCPGGEDAPNPPYNHQPEPQDIGIVAGLGLVGGALAGAFAIRNIRGTSIPYDVPLALAFLKVPIGALTAVAGILLLGGGFVPGLSELDSQRQILAYALLLGYAQQVATQLIDKQAQTLLNAVPSKDPEGKQPDPPAPTITSSTSAPPPERHADSSASEKTATANGHRAPRTGSKRQHR